MPYLGLSACIVGSSGGVLKVGSLSVFRRWRDTYRPSSYAKRNLTLLTLGILPLAKTCRPIFCAERKNRWWPEVESNHRHRDFQTDWPTFKIG